ncbi:MAG: hypothetical protein QM765_17125 [Myxococcales bacterium]
MFTAALIAVFAIASAADLPPALVVRAAGDGVAERVSSALTERMPAVRVVAGSARAGEEDLVVGLAPAAEGAWELIVERRGEQVLQRAVPTTESGPDAAFFVSCAAIVERYLQDIDWKGRPQSIDPATVAEPKPPVVRVPVPEPEAPPPTPIDWSVGLSASGAGGFFGPPKASWRVGGALDVTARRSWLLAGARAQVFAPEDRLITAKRGPDRPDQTGQVQDLRASAALMGGYCRGEDLAFCGGLQLGWRGTWVWAKNTAENPDLFRYQSAHADGFLGGLFALLALRLPARFELRALLTASGVAGDEILAEGAMAPVLATPFEVGLSLGLARRVP